MISNNKAFTLIELLITISIISILFGIALPSFDEFLDHRKVSANVQRLVQTLQLSRLKAVTENQKVTLCPASGSAACSLNWSSGYISFIDLDGDRQYNNNDRLLYQWFSTDTKLTLRWRAFGTRRSLQWLGTGITNHQNGSFEFCYNDKAENARGLFLTKAGRVRASKDTDGDNIHENSTGKPIDC
jgi:type IV fimbrial biogenesis protein FimT